MIVMPANNSKAEVHYLAGRYPGKVGWLFSPGGFRSPLSWMPYALDNGKFSVWSQGEEWDEEGYIAFIERFAKEKIKPRWALVPDVVADRIATLREWVRWASRLRALGYSLAFAVQDGMQPADVPSEADVVFVGGTTKWKWQTVPMWTANFPRVHVGRVNTLRWLRVCDRFGVESCDGTGWFRGDQKQRQGLWTYLEESTNGGDPQRELFPPCHASGNPSREVRGGIRQTA